LNEFSESFDIVNARVIADCADRAGEQHRLPVTEDTDLEALALSQNKHFWKLIDDAIARGKKEGFVEPALPPSALPLAPAFRRRGSGTGVQGSEARTKAAMVLTTGLQGATRRERCSRKRRMPPRVRGRS